MENRFGKRTAWSLLYFLNYAYFDILPIRKFWNQSLPTSNMEAKNGNNVSIAPDIHDGHFKTYGLKGKGRCGILCSSSGEWCDYPCSFTLRHICERIY